jgi:hypothetical protein
MTAGPLTFWYNLPGTQKGTVTQQMPAPFIRTTDSDGSCWMAKPLVGTSQNELKVQGVLEPWVISVQTKMSTPSLLAPVTKNVP